ncbi:MAG: hypothetical protein U9Q84_08030, partial [Thermodesulfobacteriota bacterium]|nr:hypothetical protein [Thermodesulfobacteriota bacterium]
MSTPTRREYPQEVNLKRSILMTLVLKAFIVCFPIYVLSGCAYHTKMYSGPELPKDQIAVLKGDVTITVKEVDGIVKKFTPLTRNFSLCKDGGPPVYGGFEIYLRPGTHSVRIAYCAYSSGFDYYTTTWSKKDLVLSFEATAGRV